MRSIVVVSSAIVGVFLLSLPAVAQQKTVRACQAEWRANKDANQAKGITEKAYVTQCRAAAPSNNHDGPGGASTGGRRTKDSQGLPGGMARQQGRQSGEGHNAKSLRRAVPYRRYGCGACSGSRTAHLHLHRQERRHLHQLRRHRRRPPQLLDRPRRHRRVRTNIRRKARPECDA